MTSNWKSQKSLPKDIGNGPPSRKEGEKGREAIYASVGEALTKWETLEQSLATLLPGADRIAHRPPILSGGSTQSLWINFRQSWSAHRRSGRRPKFI